MGRFKTQEYFYSDESGQKIKIKVTVNVYANGVFYFDLPTDVKLMFSGAGVSCNRIEATTFQSLEPVFKERCKDFFSKELVETKLLIRYQIATSCSYWKNRDGDIFPNGRFEDIRDKMIGVAPKYDDFYGWQETLVSSNAASPKPYGFQIWTNVVKRELFKYKSGKVWSKDEYISSDLAATIGDEPLLFLTSIVSDSKSSYDVPIMEIDYSTEVGQFFVSMYKSIFELNERIRDFVTPEKIFELAQERFALLGSPANH